MPLSIFRNYRKTFEITDADQTLSNSWCGRYGYCELSVDRDFTLDLSMINIADFEIDIRNSADSLGAITILISGGTLDVSGDLGVVIPAGGIAELKRRGNSTVVDLYGYIEA